LNWTDKAQPRLLELGVFDRVVRGGVKNKQSELTPSKQKKSIDELFFWYFIS
jgi:hypothetical protein